MLDGHIDHLLSEIEGVANFERRQNDIRKVVALHRGEIARLEMVTEALRDHVADLEERWDL